MEVIEKLRQYSRCIEIAHHIPGRIRFRLVPGDVSVFDASVLSLIAQAKGFKEALEGASGIHSIRVNAMARSCTVEYDTATIPYDAWGDFIGGQRSEASDVLAGIILNKYAEVGCA